MAKVRVITDSTAYFEPGVAERLGITVLPLNIHFGDESFREGIDITAEEFFRKLRHTSIMPTTSPPSLSDFQRAYEELIRQGADEIIAIHISSKLSQTYQVAKAATEPFLGRCRITVIDSLTTSLGLGILAEAAAKAAAQGMVMEDIVRLIRGMIPHVYIVFFVETLDYLERGGRIGKAQALLGTMLNVKPLLIVEDGEIIPLEKVRTRAKAIDKLFEFVAEFAHIEKMAILQSEFTNDTQLLIEHIHTVFPDMEVPVLTYGPVLATHVGPDTMGIIAYEGM